MKRIQFLFFLILFSSALYASSDISCLSNYIGRNQLIYHIKNLPFPNDYKVIKKQALEVSESKKVSAWVMAELRKKSLNFLNKNANQNIIDLDFCINNKTQAIARVF